LPLDLHVRLHDIDWGHRTGNTDRGEATEPPTRKASFWPLMTVVKEAIMVIQYRHSSRWSPVLLAPCIRTLVGVWL